MKKILCILCLGLTITGCGNKDEAEKTVKEEKVSIADSIKDSSEDNEKEIPFDRSKDMLGTINALISHFEKIGTIDKNDLGMDFIDAVDSTIVDLSDKYAIMVDMIIENPYDEDMDDVKVMYDEAIDTIADKMYDQLRDSIPEFRMTNDQRDYLLKRLKEFKKVIIEKSTVELDESYIDETHSVAKTDPVNTKDIRPEFKESLDAIEAYFNEYISIMKKVAQGDKNILKDYSSLIGSYADTMKKLEGLKDNNLSNEESIYYMEVYTRIMSNLLTVVSK